MRKHIVITGTGRAGTTFLVELLTHLGLDTGFREEDLVSQKHPDSHAGLEYDIRKDDCPFVVKTPWFCDYADEILHRGDIAIEHIFIPIRDLYSAAESRRRISRLKILYGGLWYTQSDKTGEQETVLLNQLYKLLLAAADSEVPVTLMRYPRITRDGAYLFSKLGPVLSGMSFARFRTEFDKTVRPEWVHQFGEHDG